MKEKFNNMKRFAFKGDSCFPLSPVNDPDESDEDNNISKNDQMIKILIYINPDDEDLSFIHDQDQNITWKI